MICRKCNKQINLTGSIETISGFQDLDEMHTGIGSDRSLTLGLWIVCGWCGELYNVTISGPITKFTAETFDGTITDHTPEEI